MYVSYINYSEKNDSNGNPTLHPFYCDSFSALYDIPKDSLCTNEKVDLEWILSSMRNTLKKIKKEPNYFFDVRTTEDFSSPAPEYALLHRLNFKNTAPLSIKGMGTLSLIQAFRISEQYLKESEIALFCLAEQYHRYDANGEKDFRGHAITFIMTKEPGEFLIEEMGFCETKQELLTLCKTEVFDAIYIDANSETLSTIPASIGLTPFLTEPFLCLNRITTRFQSFRVICISQYYNTFGYYIIRKDT